jgi:hypothetical protein
MKKAVSFCVAFLTLFLFGCTSDSSNISTTAEKQTLLSNNFSEKPNTKEFHEVFLPEVITETVDWGSGLKRANYDAFSIQEKLGNRYYGWKTKYTPEKGNTDTMVLTEGESAEAKVVYPENFPHWVIGSGAYAVLKNRYFFEWKSYTPQFGVSDGFDVKLTRIDGKKGTVEVIDQKKDTHPLEYVCKIDEEKFLSFGLRQIPSERTSYGVQMIASIYDIDGKNKEIIRENFECDQSWTDSIGTLIETFAVDNGKIFGYSRQRVAGEELFYLLEYNRSGKLLDTIPLPGMEKIIGMEKPLEMFLSGDVMAFRTYESLTNYVCKRTDKGVELVAKGVSGAMQYAVSGKYVFFIERNVDPNTALTVAGDYPLYVMSVESGEIRALNFPIPLKNPYFVLMKGLSNGDILVSYCENDYDPLKYYEYVIPIAQLEDVLDLR